MLKKPLEIFVDGPFGAPSSNIFRAEHAVLIGTGIGVTPFASILQSIMHRYWQVKRQCPRCDYQWSDDISPSMFNLKKVRTFSPTFFSLFINLWNLASRWTSSGSTATRRASSGL